MAESQLAVVMTGDEAQLWRALSKVISKEREVEKGFERTKEAAKKTGEEVDKLSQKMQKVKPPPVPPPLVAPPVQIKRTAEALQEVADAGQAAFGDAMIGRLGKYATAAYAVEQGIALIRGAMNKVKADTDAAIASADRLANSRRNLVQVAESPADLASLTGTADRLAAKYGVDRQVAQNVVFTARSEDFEDAVPDLMRGEVYADPLASAAVAGKVRVLFPKANLSAMEAINIVAKAAQQSSLDFDTMAGPMAQAAEGAALTGSTPEETAAILSLLSANFKSGETAADRVKGFATKVGISADPRLQGKGIIDAMRVIRDDFSDAERALFLGESQELNAAYRRLSEGEAEIVRRQQEIEEARRATGTPESPWEQGIATAFTDPIIAAQKRAARARIGAEIANEMDYAEGGANVAAAKDMLRQQLSHRRANAVSRYSAELGMNLADVFFNDPEIIYSAGAAPGALFSPSTLFGMRAGESSNALENAARDLERAAANLERSTAAPRVGAQRAEVGRHRE